MSCLTVEPELYRHFAVRYPPRVVFTEYSDYALAEEGGAVFNSWLPLFPFETFLDFHIHYHWGNAAMVRHQQSVSNGKEVIGYADLKIGVVHI